MKIRVGKVAPRPKATRIVVGGRPKASSIVYERTTCCWSIRQTSRQIRT